jgi:RimJ/RimL family protein N-acetyltransferase
MRPTPIVLELSDGAARLEPLRADHAAGLFEVGREPEIWRYLPAGPPRDVEGVAAFIRRALDGAAVGTELPFAIIERASGRAVGSTRYLEIQPGNRALEIGATWIAPAWQRTAVNTECKYLLLRHAFEGLGAVRVQLKTDGRNERSQRAIERLGAKREGCLRKSRILHDGYIRDTVMYSVIAEEWAGVKERLEARLGAR